MPVSSLGKKYVDFGGIVSPAPAISRTCPTGVGRRKKAALERSLESARARRDDAVGPSERHRAQSELARLEERLQTTTAELASLVARQDEDYQRWRRDFHARRFRPPTVTSVLTAPFTLTRGAS